MMLLDLFYLPKSIFFKSMYNDTIYTVLDNIITPTYFVNMGKYRLPNDLRPEPPQTY